MVEPLVLDVNIGVPVDLDLARDGVRLEAVALGNLGKSASLGGVVGQEADPRLGARCREELDTLAQDRGRAGEGRPAWAASRRRAPGSEGRMGAHDASSIGRNDGGGSHCGCCLVRRTL